MKWLQTLPRMNVGGVERGVLDLAKYFKARGQGYWVLSGGGGLVKELEKNGAVHVTMPVYSKSPVSLLLIPKVRKLFNDNKIDLAHGRSRVPGWIAFFATRGTDTNFITTAHGVYKNRAFSEVMGWGKFVICPSKTVARHMRENFGVPEEKIVVINRWVDLDQFEYTPYEKRKDSNVIVAVGRIAPNKGYEYLIESFKKIVRVNPYMTLKIVGEPDKSKMKYFQYLNTLLNRYSLHYNVKFTGFTLDVGNELKSARALVAPSVEDESFGRVIAEAFACGVPVVATKVGGYSEVIDHGVDGLLVPARSADAISDALLEIINQPHLAESFSRAGRKKVEDFFTLKKCAPEEEAVYQKAVNTNRVAVMKFSALGDLVLIIPTLKMLKNSIPGCSVTLVTLKKYAPLFSGCPYVDNVIALDGNYKKLKNIREISRRMRRMGLDYIFDFQNNWASQLISFLAFARKSFGFSRKLGFLFTRKAKFPKKGTVDPISSQELITSLAGLKISDKKLIFWPTSHDIGQFGLKGKYLGINVSASAKWATKNWPKENIIKFIELFSKSNPDFDVLLLGDENSASTAAQVVEGLPKARIVNLCGKTTLFDLIEILRKVKVFVTPDTAALHLAQSLGCAVVALFGPTNPEGHVVKTPRLKIIEKNISCAHCYRSKCSKHDCMREITPAEVLSAVKELI